jgi:hypothetical protein
VQFDPVCEFRNVIHSQSDEFGPTECSCKSDQEQCTVTRCLQRRLLIYERQDLEQVVFRQSLDSPLRRAISASNTFHGALHLHIIDGR